jgi:hypothetical protein
VLGLSKGHGTCVKCGVVGKRCEGVQGALVVCAGTSVTGQQQQCEGCGCEEANHATSSCAGVSICVLC